MPDRTTMPDRLNPQQLDAAERAYNKRELAIFEAVAQPARHREALRYAVEAVAEALTESQLVDLLASARRRRLLAESDVAGIEQQCPLRHEIWASDTDDAIALFISAMLSELGEHDGVKAPEDIDWTGEEADMRHDRHVDHVRKSSDARAEGI